MSTRRVSIENTQEAQTPSNFRFPGLSQTRSATHRPNAAHYLFCVASKVRMDTCQKNKVLVENSHAHSFTKYIWQLSCYNDMAQEASSLALYWKCLPTSAQVTRWPVCWVFTMLFQWRVQPHVLPFNILRSSSPTHFHPLPPRWGPPDRRQNGKWLAELFSASSMNIPTAAQRKTVQTGGLLPLTGAGPGRFPRGLQERDGKAVLVRFHRGKGWTTKLGRQRPAGHRAQTCKRHLITGCVWKWKERYLPESAPDWKIYFDELLGEGVVDKIY